MVGQNKKGFFIKAFELALGGGQASSGGRSSKVVLHIVYYYRYCSTSI